MFHSAYFLIAMMIQMETEMIDRHHLNYHISATHKTLEEKYFYRPEVSEFGLE